MSTLARETHDLSAIADLVLQNKFDEALRQAKVDGLPLAEHTVNGLMGYMRQWYEGVMKAELMQTLSRAGENKKRMREKAATLALLKTRAPFVAGLSRNMQDQLVQKLLDNPGRLQQLSGVESATGEKFQRLFAERYEKPLDGILLSEDIPTYSRKKLKEGEESEILSMEYRRVYFTSAQLSRTERSGQLAIDVTVKKSTAPSVAKEAVTRAANCYTHIAVMDVGMDEPMKTFMIHPDYTPDFDRSLTGAPLYRTAGEPRDYAIAPDAIAARMADIAELTKDDRQKPHRVDQIPTLSEEDERDMRELDLLDPDNLIRRSELLRKQDRIETIANKSSLAALPGNGAFADVIRGIDWQAEMEKLSEDLPLLLAMDDETADPTNALQPVNEGIPFPRFPYGGSRSTHR